MQILHRTTRILRFGHQSLDRATSSIIDGVHRVAAFVEQPTVAGAVELRAGGALRSTADACGSVAAFLELGRSAEPQLLDILDSLVPLIGTEDEADAIDYIYRTRMPVRFGRDICERGAQQIRRDAGERHRME